MNFFKKLANNKWIQELVVIISLIFMFSVLWSLYWQMNSEQPDPITVMILLIAGSAVFIFVSVFIVSNRIDSIFSVIRRGRKRMSRLRKRIIIAFSIGAALPAISVAVFSIYFFNISVQTWFDEKVTNVLDQSIIVGESYISEHIIQLKETSLSVADDLNQMYYDLIHNTDLFNKVLNAQAEMRSIDEAIIFRKDTNTILAQTSLSFSLSFATIPSHLIERANSGEVVRVPSDKTKIRMLIKLQDYNDTYLLLGRLVDTKIINHISETEGSVNEYKRLKGQINSMQIKFSFVFIFVTLLFVAFAVVGGRNFAERIVRPIRRLVMATEKVKNGDLSIQVEEKDLEKDETRVLTSAFNRMVQQIDRQQKELIIAQRAMAWSDVARQVAHEIKNPLTPIQLSADRLLMKFSDDVKDKAAFKKYIDNIVRKSNDIKSIVSEFVNFARLPAPKFSRCNLTSYISDIVDSRRLIHDRINYKYNYSHEVIDFVCDVAQLNQIMENLLQNAEDSIYKNTKSPEIIIDIKSSDDEVQLIVSDNGEGFSSKLLETAKDAYVTTKKKGTGLGLAIVERMVQDHYGSIEIANNPSGGGAVRLSFNQSMLKEKF